MRCSLPKPTSAHVMCANPLAVKQKDAVRDLRHAHVSGPPSSSTNFLGGFTCRLLRSMQSRGCLSGQSGAPHDCYAAGSQHVRRCPECTLTQQGFLGSAGSSPRAQCMQLLSPGSERPAKRVGCWHSWLCGDGGFTCMWGLLLQINTPTAGCCCPSGLGEIRVSERNLSQFRSDAG